MTAKDESDPSTRKSNAFCEFHQERGHKIENCIRLRQEVVQMLSQGHLKELLSDRGQANFACGREQPQGPPKLPSPARTIQMIINRGDGIEINHVKFTTTHNLKRSITHERIADTNVKRVMVDDGSGACIILPRVLVQLRLEDKIISRCITLRGFNNLVERNSGKIVLPFLDGGVTLEMTFHFMNQETAYNAIIGRPWIHAMQAVPSSLYQAIKFPPHGEYSAFEVSNAPHKNAMHRPRLHPHPATQRGKCGSIAISDVGTQTCRTDIHYQGP
uniref:Uncharacterized protein LOC104210685 n=1 Tax=Nicotiana sylvestris TaxID=4096 RepID=A0A1U7UUP9_NICSY|nr:PREDICTED: uncharacterized protein LOC104210685 [Nicotiana sylvestris]